LARSRWSFVNASEIDVFDSGAFTALGFPSSHASQVS
jgi:hypothetical protein